MCISSTVAQYKGKLVQYGKHPHNTDIKQLTLLRCADKKGYIGNHIEQSSSLVVGVSALVTTIGVFFPGKDT